MVVLRKINPILTIATRRVRNWHVLRPFPPNYYKDHQIFYPSLSVILKERENTMDAKHYTDVGLEIPEIKGKSRREARLERETKTKSTQYDEKVLLEMLSQKEEEVKFDINLANDYWPKSRQGLENIVRLANHYAIYEHLLPTPPKLEEKIPSFKHPDFHPQFERELTWELEKYHPGTVRVGNPPSKEIKFFYPIAPMRIEFTYCDNPKDEELSILPVYRGNHILPKFTKDKPDVLIDVTFLNGNQTPIPADYPLNGVQLFGEENKDNMYTLALVNLDTQFGDSDPICHWMVSNIRQEKENTLYDEMISFLPPYAFRGFGYHRYVFLLLKQSHKRNAEKVDDYLLSKRIINFSRFIEEEKAQPIGLMWFQSTWDETCRKTFHDLLDMREPTYDYIQPKQPLAEQAKFPGKVPFNIYLDLYRDRKEINKEVLLDRLKLVDPFDYKKLYEKRKVPPALHRPHKRHHPTWYKATYFKKDFMLGPYRGLRNESAIQPLKNNADLDYPMWPMAKSLVLPMFYPYKDGKQKRIKDTKWVLPAKHHPSLRDEDEHIRENREEELKEDLKNVKEVTDSVLSRKL